MSAMTMRMGVTKGVVGLAGSQSSSARQLLVGNVGQGARQARSAMAVRMQAGSQRDVKVSAVSTVAPPAESAAAAPRSGKNWIEEKLEEEFLESSTYHKVLVGTSFAVCAALDLQGIMSDSSATSLGFAALAAYFAADLGSGVYHFLVDNYGSENTPLVGEQIKLFQGHHQRPWTITHRAFCNNVHKICKPALPAGLALLALPLPGSVDVFGSTFLALIIFSQQIHAWSHMKKSQLPPAVSALQSAGLLLTIQAHGKHHLPPFEDNYCIVSGMWNPLLDSTGAFNKLEHVINDATGVPPRSWFETTDDWLEVNPDASFDDV